MEIDTFGRIWVWMGTPFGMFIMNQYKEITKDLVILLQQNKKRRGTGKKCHSRNYDAQ